VNHAWCKDITRDAAVRSAEDGRTEPLPTLEEAIGMLPKSDSASSTVDHKNKGDDMGTKRDEQAADYRAEERERVAPAGMRTERVTLEVTGAPGWRVHVNGIDVESVRVLDGAHFDDLDHMAMERDTAIRERESWKILADRANDGRDKLQARVAELERDNGHLKIAAKINFDFGNKAEARVSHLEDANRALKDAADTASGWVDELNTRVAELESQLESVACRAATAETALDARTSTSGEGSRDAQAASGGGAWRCAITSPPPVGEYKLCRWVTTVCGNREVCYGVGARRPDGMWGLSNQVEMIRPEQWQELPDGPSVGRQWWEREAAGGGGEGEVVAWGVRYPDGRVSEHQLRAAAEMEWEANDKNICLSTGATASGICVFPIHAPPQPRGWLTEEERGVINRVRDHLFVTDQLEFTDIVTLDALLARSSPPDVVKPKRWDDMRSTIGDQRDAEWVAALAAAGVAVKEVGRG